MTKKNQYAHRACTLEIIVEFAVYFYLGFQTVTDYGFNTKTDLLHKRKGRA